MTGSVALLGLVGAAILGLVACLSFPLVRSLERTPSILIAITVLLYVLSTLYPGDLLPSLPLGGFSIFPMDLLSVALVALAFPRYYTWLKYGFGRNEGGILLLLGWGLILGVNYVLGIKEYDIQNSTNEFRNFLYVGCVSLYVASLDVRGLWPKIEKCWLLGALGLCIIAVVGLSDGDLSRDGRPLSATATLFLAQTFLIALFLFQRGELTPARCLFGFSLLPMILILQHRSVWVVTACSFCAVAYLVPNLRDIILKWGSIAALVFGLITSVFFGERIYEALQDSYKEAFSTSSTFTWRTKGWTSLLTGEYMDSPREILFGNTFGTGYAREMYSESGKKVEVKDASPHNFYVQALLRSGAVGLLFFLSLHAILIRGLYHISQRHPSYRYSSLCLLVLLLAQCIFFIPYGFNAVNAVFLGFGIAALREPEMLTTDS
ncbi:O-antigen ligase family protein [Coraliomargarita akajimensis]|uniref:O-antigen ligase-related domain-containing protein n=1 Tax=Coraliomargarita akajimensis (strain DSM 45221 / IAM 15411 / JCM 23193 / KCTC 12865 / 04OKA010-24) TaxID=583355 RepID=D5EML4_CORAD|nr:O-antigen ligase family protein [Coraliomargarita akajimensis]ADE53420.1 hypothetical protein Caka_0395 [Coraliomargarita akajimensis DSM 45221]